MAARSAVIAPLEILPPRGTSFPLSVFNLTNCVVGSGILALPFAFASLGMAATLGVVALVGSITLFSLHLVVVSAAATDAKNYGDIARSAFGPWICVVVNLAISYQMLSVMTAFLVIIGDLFPPFLREVAGAADSSSPFFGRAFLTALLLVFAIVPLAGMKHISALTHTSTVSIVGVIYVSICLVVYGIKAVATTGYQAQDIKWADFSLESFYAFPILAFALGCHVQVPPVFWEYRRPTVKGFFPVVASSLTLACVLYTLVGSMGYLTFLEGTEGNILVNFAPDNIPIAIVGRLVMSFVVCFSYPLLMWPARNALLSLYDSCGCCGGAAATGGGSTDASHSTDPLLDAARRRPSGLTAGEGGSGENEGKGLSDGRRRVDDDDDDDDDKAGSESSRTDVSSEASDWDAPPPGRPTPSLHGDVYLTASGGHQRSVGAKGGAAADSGETPTAAPVVVGTNLRSVRARNRTEPLRRWALTVAVAGVTYAASVLVPSITVIFGLSGSTAAAFLMYILPSLFFLRVAPEARRLPYKIAAVLTCVYGVVMGTTCTTLILYHMVTDDGSGSSSA